MLFLNREPHDAVVSRIFKKLIPDTGINTNIYLFQNGTWYFVEVQAKPKFDHHPDPVVYVSIRDSTVLACTVSIIYNIYFHVGNVTKIKSNAPNNVTLPIAQCPLRPMQVYSFYKIHFWPLYPSKLLH